MELPKNMIGTAAVLTFAIAAVPAFIASIVEWVEAFTIVLAVGNTRGWRHRPVRLRYTAGSRPTL